MKKITARTKQPQFVREVPGSLRVFSNDATALPPFPCMLCEAAFAPKQDLAVHVRDCHCGLDEYRKRVIYLSRERLRPVTPQQWRNTVESHTEEYVIGADDWPKCESESAATSNSWWLPPDQCGEGNADGCKPSEGVDLTALGRERGADRADVRAVWLARFVLA